MPIWKPKASDAKYEEIDVQARLSEAAWGTRRSGCYQESESEDRLRSFLGRVREGYTSDLLKEHWHRCFDRARLSRRPLWRTCAGEPDDELLHDCKAKIKETGAHLGIACDGDADRFGIVDSDGTFIQPNYVIALLFDYLVQTRGWKNGVAKSVATTNLVNALADEYKIPLHETPVGFKFIGELIIKDEIAIGGEERCRADHSRPCAGEGWTDRRPADCRDGCHPPGKSVGEQLKELFARVGSYYPGSRELPLDSRDQGSLS